MVMMKFEINKTSSLPLHIQLLDELRHKVRTGAFNAHDRLPGEWELASELDISRATIQKAWQSAEEEGLIYRIPGKGTFVAAARLPETTRNAVGLVVPDFRGTFAVHLLSGAERVLRKQGYSVQLASTEYDVREENRVLARMQTDGMAGCMVWAVRDTSGERRLPALAQTMPIVLMDRPLAGIALPCVTSNNYMGGQQAMAHLLELGHQRIAFLARPHLELWTVAERYRAYQDMLRAAGETPLAPILIGDERELSSYTAYIHGDDAALSPLVTLLRQPDRPTAIFAVNDWMALRALRAAASAGLRVPDDLSLVGFDNLDVSEYLSPPLTTIAQDADILGEETARHLLALINGETPNPVLTMVPTRLIVRQSTRAL